MHLATAKHYAPTTDADDWAGHKGLTMDLGHFAVEMDMASDESRWSVQMEECCWYDGSLRLGTASGALKVDGGMYALTLLPVTIALRPIHLAWLFDIWYGNICRRDVQSQAVHGSSPSIP